MIYSQTKSQAIVCGNLQEVAQKKTRFFHNFTKNHPTFAVRTHLQLMNNSPSLETCIGASEKPMTSIEPLLRGQFIPAWRGLFTWAAEPMH